MVVHAVQAQGIHYIAHFHDPIWVLIKNDNIYLILSLHKDLHADHKMTILGAELLHMKF